MRNPLKRIASTDKPRLPIRERLAAMKEKYGRTLRVHRALNAPVPKAEPVDRVALINYATFLDLERTRVCAELYPHMGIKATQFVLSLNAAWEFFSESRGSTVDRKGLPPASSRAVKVLDLVGIDWRSDCTEERRRFFDESNRADNGERPSVPHGWPALDAALTEALDDLERLDAAIGALHSGISGRDADTVPGYVTLELERRDAITRLTKIRARGLPGLQAKAHALRTDGIGADYDATGALAVSLARDLIGAGRTWLDEHRPDPILPLITEAERLEAVVSATFDEWPNNLSEPPDLIERREDASEALWQHVRGTLLTTVPTTAIGCKALAKFMGRFLKGTDLNDDGPAILDLIARSPLRP